MRSNWRPFIQPDNAITTNRNGSRRWVIANDHYRRRGLQHLDIPSNLTDRVSGHYGIASGLARIRSESMGHVPQIGCARAGLARERLEFPERRGDELGNRRVNVN